jgi:hypothetical protein
MPWALNAARCANASWVSPWAETMPSQRGQLRSQRVHNCLLDDQGLTPGHRVCELVLAQSKACRVEDVLFVGKRIKGDRGVPGVAD